MAEDIEARGSLDSGRHCSRVERIADSQSRLQVSMRDTSFGSLGDEVKDGSSGGLTSCAGGGRDCDERLQWLVDWPSLSERSIDKVEEVGIWVCCVKVHELGGVNDGTSANSEERVDVLRASPCNCFLDPGVPISSCLLDGHEKMNSRAILGLNHDIGVDLKLNALSAESLTNLPHGIQLVNIGISDNGNPLGAHVLEVHADFLSDARAETNRRGRHLKGILLLGRVRSRSGVLAPAGISSPRNQSWLLVISWVGVART